MMYERYINELRNVFEKYDDRYKCHELAQPIMREMAANEEVLHDLIKKNLLEGNYWTSKRTIVIDLEIEQNTLFEMRGHCFMPLPDRKPLISHQSIHHHGNLLLTTAAVFGEKYTSILFERKIEQNEDESYTLSIKKIYDFKKGQVEFVDSYQPHIVFQPEDLFITYTIWSADRKYDLHKFKNNFLLRQFKKPLKFVLKQTGIDKKLGVNNIQNFDFYPYNGKIYRLKDRNEIPFPRPKENYIRNLFYIMQKVKFYDIEFLESLKNKISMKDFELMDKYIEKLRNNETITDEFLPEHTNIKNVNFPFDRIIECFPDKPLLK